jgi:signal transduction histidine kinase
VHDLRNPLFAIRGYAEMLATKEFGPLTASQSELLRRLLQNTQELEQLLTAVLSPTVDP